MSITKAMATKSLDQAEKMENLTTHMKQIALKTEKETIFMRIITVVTLLFLPGTFVAVSHLHLVESLINKLTRQTLMSTDIVKWQNDNDLISRFSWQALVMYLGITLPIMAFTLWVAFWYRRREQNRLKVQRGENEDDYLDLEASILIGK